MLKQIEDCPLDAVLAVKRLKNTMPCDLLVEILFMFNVQIQTHTHFMLVSHRNHFDMWAAVKKGLLILKPYELQLKVIRAINELQGIHIGCEKCFDDCHGWPHLPTKAIEICEKIMRQGSQRRLLQSEAQDEVEFVTSNPFMECIFRLVMLQLSYYQGSEGNLDGWGIGGNHVKDVKSGSNQKGSYYEAVTGASYQILGEGRQMSKQIKWHSEQHAYITRKY